VEEEDSCKARVAYNTFSSKGCVASSPGVTETEMVQIQLLKHYKYRLACVVSESLKNYHSRVY
jgi:hypothetical protein